MYSVNVLLRNMIFHCKSFFSNLPGKKFLYIKIFTFLIADMKNIIIKQNVFAVIQEGTNILVLTICLRLMKYCLIWLCFSVSY